MKFITLVSGILVASLLSACGGSESPSSTALPPLVQAGAPTPSILGEPLRIDQIPEIGKTATLGRKYGRMLEGVAVDGLVVDTQDREAVRQFYNGLYLGVPEAPMNWTGSYATGDSGTVSQAYQDSTLLRINWYRAMAGVPAGTTLSADYNAKDQAAAMLMSVNNQLSHFPPTTWANYNSVAAEGAAHSNLALAAGVRAIDSSMMDGGESNFFVGHRRWLLYPQTRQFGSGSVPGRVVDGLQTNSPANAVWAVDAAYFDPRPSVRDDFVAWPPRGYVPYPLVSGRWSFSYPRANFRQVKITVSLADASLAVRQEPVTDGYGENTLAWLLPATTSYTIMAKPASDQRYSVTLSNVLVDGKPRTFSYDVIVFDPAIITPGASRTAVLPMQDAYVGTPFTLALSPMKDATGYEIRQYQRQSLGGTIFNTSNSSGNWVAVTSGNYNSMSGASFNLHHADYTDQSLTLNKQLLVGSKANVSLTRATGYVTSAEILHIQVSEDDGTSWSDVYAEAGSGMPSASRPVQVSLAGYSGRKIRLRLLLALSGGGYYLCDDCGWNISDISIADSDELLNEQVYAVPASGSIITSIAQPGEYVMFGRTQYQSRYYTELGAGTVMHGTAMHGDSATLTGKRSNYSIVKTDAGYVITDTVGGDGVQTVRNPFRLDFSDVTVAFDFDGNAGKAYRLYQAAFNRQPDLSGLGFWIKALDSGYSLVSMASGFTGSAEFKQVYGAAPSKDQLVRAMYTNALHRAPDAEGYAFWLNALNNGLSVENLLLDFSESSESRIQVAPNISYGIAYIRY